MTRIATAADAVALYGLLSRAMSEPNFDNEPRAAYAAALLKQQITAGHWYIYEVGTKIQAAALLRPALTVASDRFHCTLFLTEPLLTLKNRRKAAAMLTIENMEMRLPVGQRYLHFYWPKANTSIKQYIDALEDAPIEVSPWGRNTATDEVDSYLIVWDCQRVLPKAQQYLATL